MSMLTILLTATAIVQAVLLIACFLRYPQTRLPAMLLGSLALCYAMTATFGYDCLASVHRASSLDPLADWIDLLIQYVIVTGTLFAGVCAANIWLAFSISVDTNTKRRFPVVDADAQQPVS